MRPILWLPLAGALLAGLTACPQPTPAAATRRVTLHLAFPGTPGGAALPADVTAARVGLSGPQGALKVNASGALDPAGDDVTLSPGAPEVVLTLPTGVLRFDASLQAGEVEDAWGVTTLGEGAGDASVELQAAPIVASARLDAPDAPQANSPLTLTVTALSPSGSAIPAAGLSLGTPTLTDGTGSASAGGGSIALNAGERDGTLSASLTALNARHESVAWPLSAGLVYRKVDLTLDFPAGGPAGADQAVARLTGTSGEFRFDPDGNVSAGGTPPTWSAGGTRTLHVPANVPLAVRLETRLSGRLVADALGQASLPALSGPRELASSVRGILDHAGFDLQGLLYAGQAYAVRAVGYSPNGLILPPGDFTPGVPALQPGWADLTLDPDAGTLTLGPAASGTLYATVSGLDANGQSVQAVATRSLGLNDGLVNVTGSFTHPTVTAASLDGQGRLVVTASDPSGIARLEVQHDAVEALRLDVSGAGPFFIDPPAGGWTPGDTLLVTATNPAGNDSEPYPLALP